MHGTPFTLNTCTKRSATPTAISPTAKTENCYMKRRGETIDSRPSATAVQAAATPTHVGNAEGSHDY